MNDSPLKLHPHFSESNVKGFPPKTERFQSEWFAQKFTISLMKLMELKGVKLALNQHNHNVEHHPELLSNFNEVMVFEIIHQDRSFGFFYLEAHFLGLLLHKVLGGGDKVQWAPAKIPLGKIESKSLETAFGIFNLSLREGLKRSFPLRDIDFIQLRGPLDEFKFTQHLDPLQFLKEEFVFDCGASQVGLTLMLQAKVFCDSGK